MTTLIFGVFLFVWAILAVRIKHPLLTIGQFILALSLVWAAAFYSLKLVGFAAESTHITGDYVMLSEPVEYSGYLYLIVQQFGVNQPPKMVSIKKTEQSESQLKGARNQGKMIISFGQTDGSTPADGDGHPSGPANIKFKGLSEMVEKGQ